MPIITFWSNKNKAIGQTVSASLVATMMAIEYNYKILLISSDLDNDVMEDCFGAQESNKDIIKFLVKKRQMDLGAGTTGLLKLAKSNRLTPEVIPNYTKIVFGNRLEILYSPKENEENEEEDRQMDKNQIMDGMKKIIMNAARYYDYVFVDLTKDKEFRQQQEILQLSNVVVGCIDQKINTITELLSSEDFINIQDKLIWNICKHDKNSKYNSNNLMRTILKKQPVYQTDYNSLIHDSSQEGGISELLLRLKTLRVDDENLSLISNIKKLVEAIITKNKEMQYKV